MSTVRLSGMQKVAAVVLTVVAPGLLLSACVSNYAERPKPEMRRAEIPLPSRRLLKRPAEPQCLIGKPDLPRPEGTLSERVQLEFERDCFRSAERRVRKQLVRLQAAVRKTRKAAAEQKAK